MKGRRFVWEKGSGVVEVGQEPCRELDKPIVSDALGFSEQQFNDFEADRVKNGHVGIEFVRDKDVPQFFQVKCSSREAWAKYVKHRGMYDRNSRNGGSFTIDDKEFDRLKQEMLKKYPPRVSQEKNASPVEVCS